MADTAISFIDSDVQRCPFAAYAAVRDGGPVYFDPSCGFYIVTGYAEVRKALADTTNYSNVTGLLLVKDAPYQTKIDAIYETHGFLPVNTLTVSDPPLHTFHRALVDKVFTVSRVKQMEDYLRGICDGMIDKFIDKGECDFFREFASRAPIYVIADQMGVKVDDIERFKMWSDAVIQEGDPNNGEERQIELTHTICELQQYIARAAEQYRREPANCLLSDLVHAEDNGRRMSMRELVSIVVILLVAGNDTTASAMASTMYELAKDPELQNTLREKPERLANFIEEALRFHAPVQGLYRRVLNDMRIGDVDIPKGSTIIVRYGAANRDPVQFPNPDNLVATRSNTRTHLTFGAGPHHCIGSQLSRGELRGAFTTLLRRLKNIRLAHGEEGVTWISHFFAYGPQRLDIAFDKI